MRSKPFCVPRGSALAARRGLTAAPTKRARVGGGILLRWSVEARFERVRYQEMTHMRPILYHAASALQLSLAEPG